MAFPTPTYPHPNHRDHQQPHLQNQMQHWTSRPNGLNPRTPGFIPTGMELQHFHTSSLPPNNNPNSYQITSTNNNNHNNNFHSSTLPDPTTFSDFQNYIYRQHIHHLNGITKLQTASRETDEAVAETREVVKKDLGTLYRLLQQQQKRIDELSFSPPTASAGGDGAPGGDVEQQSFQAVVEQRVHDASKEPGIWDVEVVEPAVMLQRFDPRVVAELYEEQAGKMGELVQRLRGFAALARNRVDGGQLGYKVSKVGNGDGSPLGVDGSGVASRDFASDSKGPLVDSSEGQIKLRAHSKEVESAIQDRGREPSSKSSPQLLETERAASPIEQNNTTIQPSTTIPWIPFALRNLQPTSPPLLPDPNQTFTWDFLFNTLSGIQWSPGFYFNPTPSSPSRSNLPLTKSYWLLDTPFEPFLPSAPGQPGAKITAFFNDTLPDSEENGKGDNGRSAAPTEHDYLHTPIFISPDPLDVPADERRYTYFGHYSQKRFSDRIGYDTLRERIPERVLRFWAESLASPERPGWITRQLMRVFWPRPVYEGPVFAEDAGETGSVGSGSEEVEEGDERVMCALRGYARELAEWEKEARERVGLLKPEDLLDSFEMSDAAAQPGLRLWWEYFEFVEFDRGFYDGLVDAQEKREQKKIAAAVKTKKKEVAARKSKEEKINPTPAYVKEDARMEKEVNPAHTLAGNALSAQNGGCDDRKALNPLTMKYQHPYFPDTNEQPSSPPTPLSKAEPKISSSKKPTTTKPKSPLSKDWSNAPRPNQPTPSPRINNSNSFDTSWNPPASPPANKSGTPKPSHHQPDRNTNGIPETKKKSTTGNCAQPRPTTAGKGAEKPPSHFPNAKALEEARRFQQNATKARERRGGGGGGARGGPPHLRR
ncbi:hypothetical protein KC354_g16205 [Hortaea werneckii]|nr:hypothetical protein KC354_g16205 [Hortaea werneckii]